MSYTDGQGRSGSGTILGGRVRRGIEDLVPAPTPHIDIAVPPPAPVARCRFLVEKAGELGVRRVMWLEIRHSQVRPPNLVKAQSWAIAALEQSRGLWLTEVGSTTTLSELGGEVWVADPSGDQIPRVDRDVTLAVGPAGGFDRAEIDEFSKITLGPSLLRSETAVVVGVTLLRERMSRTTG